MFWMFFIAVAVAIVIAAYNWHFNLYETAVSFDGSLTLEWMNNIRKCCDGFFFGNGYTYGGHYYNAGVALWCFLEIKTSALPPRFIDF